MLGFKKKLEFLKWPFLEFLKNYKMLTSWKNTKRSLASVEQIMMKGSEHKKQLLINYYREEEKQITAPINEEEPEPELEEDITSEKKSAAKYAEPKK